MSHRPSRLRRPFSDVLDARCSRDAVMCFSKRLAGRHGVDGGLLAHGEMHGCRQALQPTDLSFFV